MCIRFLRVWEELPICLPYGRKRFEEAIIEATPTPVRGEWVRLDWIAVAAIVLGAAIIRLAGLNRPTELVFDEIFYARDACRYVFGTESVCGINELASRAHPPLGKWIIGSGIATFGYDPFGWRVAVAAAGTVSVGLVYVLAWWLLRGVVSNRAVTVGAAAASGLLALDFLHVVHSRVAMLDALITLFVIGAVLAIVADRDRNRERADPPWWWRLTLGRPWRLAAGACIGAAAATKWSGAYVAPAIIGLVIAWEVAARRRANPGMGWRGAFAGAFRSEAVPTFVLLGLVPVAVYLASYIGRMPGELIALPWETGSVWRGIYDHTEAMLDFHTSLAGNHPYQSPTWSWPLLRRPVAYWFAADGGTYREILALGNPLFWWPGLLALGVLAITWARRSWRLDRPEPVILAAALATYVPWLVLSGDRSQTFLWYFLPTVPFLGLALGLVAGWAWSRVAGRVGAVAYGAVIAASFLFYFPLLTALPLEAEAWRQRILFGNCEGGAVGSGRSLPDDSSSQGDPPPGWCWI